MLPTKGPKRGLSLDRIVAAGVRVAATDGLGAVSMGRVAAEVGAATMTLYRYVAAKDDLVDLMVDAALGRPPEPPHDEDGWRAGLRRWAEGVRAAYQRHPWALRVPITAPPLGPNNIRWLKNALTCLRHTPMQEQEKLSTVLLVSGFVRNETTLTADLTARLPEGAQAPQNYGMILARLADPQTFPSVHAAISAGALNDEDGVDTEFEFGLGRILDGIDALIRSRLAPP